MPYYVHPPHLSNVDEIACANVYSEHPDFNEVESYEIAPWNSDACATAYASAKAKGRKVTLALTPHERDLMTRALFVKVDLYPLPDDWPSNPAHYAYASMTKPGHVAYTPDDNALAQNKQIVVTPGTYLKRFWPELAHKDIHALASKLSKDALTLKIATTPDDIERVYRAWSAKSAHIQSCMGPDCHSGSVSYDNPVGKGKHWHDHPCRVYGDSDLAVAYLGDIDDIRARCVVWPEKMRYGRLYASDSELFKQALESAGYTSGSMSGAKIRAICHSSNGGYLMPYVDGISSADLRGDYFTLGRGSYCTSGTCGYVDADCDEHGECANCGGECDNDNTYCDSCADEQWTCGNCGEDYFDDNGNGGYSETYCDHCWRENSHECVICRDDYNDYAYSNSERRRRQREGYANAEVCRSCESCAVCCSSCDTWFDSDDSGQTVADAHYCDDCEDEALQARHDAYEDVEDDVHVAIVVTVTLTQPTGE